MGGFSLLSFNFLALCFPVFFLVSATSSYADDIAYIKILRAETDVVFHSREDGVFVFLSFLRVVLTSCCF
jgi:hypothetical protein